MAQPGGVLGARNLENLAKDAATGPALWQDDSTLEKTFHITERNDVIFRAEAFNLFNRAQYGQPSAGLDSLTCAATNPCTPGVAVNQAYMCRPGPFGKVTQTVPPGLVGAFTPRELEFALRVTY